jgi:hypothetical protein
MLFHFFLHGNSTNLATAQQKPGSSGKRQPGNSNNSAKAPTWQQRQPGNSDNSTKGPTQQQRQLGKRANPATVTTQ